jgi:hypothetical protein
MSEQTDPPLISKGYLYVLPVVVVGIVLNLLFNQEARDLVGLKQGKAFSLKGLFGGRVSGPAAVPEKPLTFSAADVRAFTESFTRSEVRVLVLPPETPSPDDEKRKREEEERRKREEAEKSLPPPDLPWPVTVQGTFQDQQGRWTAIIAGHYCRTGKELVSDKPGRCVYKILAVGRKCVWLHAYPSDKPEPPVLPDIEWPDVALIETAREGILKRRYVPARVRLANGVTVRKGDTLVYETTRVRFTAAELWEAGVVFEARQGEQSAKIACMLVTAR